MSQRGLIIAGIRSGSGKTTVALGLMRALARRGRQVQAFKCGPDYIDPAFHGVATGRPSFNLDSWAMAPGYLDDLVMRHPADIAVAEGVMGLFDGVGGRGATADVAAMLGWPVVLVLDVNGQTETAAAVAAGCAHYRDDVKIAGVILNRVASLRHLRLIRPALEKIGIPLFGALAQNDDLVLPERHLGLIQAAETTDIERRLDRLADILDNSVDLDALEQSAKPIPRSEAAFMSLPPPGQRIALAQDRAFSFIYPHLLEQWRLAGAEILPFSPLADEVAASDADVVWLPGGYPELHAGVISNAHRFLAGLRRAATGNVTVHGECGGYMVLGNGLVDAGGVRHAMAGLLPLETSFAQRRLHLGYRNARLRADCALGEGGKGIVGHEFHYASILSVAGDPLVDCVDAYGDRVPESGSRHGRVSGTFFHFIGESTS